MEKADEERFKMSDEKQANVDKMHKSIIAKRRVRMLMVNPADFMVLFTKGVVFDKRTKLLQGVPGDAQIIAVAPDSVRNGIMLVVESKEYDEIPVNILPPVQPVEIEVGVRDATKKVKKRK